MKNLAFLDLSKKYQAKQQQIQGLWSDILQHQQFVNGPECQKLEERLAITIGVKHALTVSSGTDALLCALLAAGVQPGDEVITSAHSFAATVEAILMLGATPVYVDIAASDWNLDIGQLNDVFSEKTRAVLAVSLYGKPCDLKNIQDFCRSKNIPFIEDASQSFAARRDGLVSGAVADLSVTSFFPSKPLGGAGNLGAVFTNDEGLALKLRAIRCHGQLEKYNHQLMGWNAMPSTLIAASLLALLDDFPDEILKRQDLAQEYGQKIKGLPQAHRVFVPEIDANVSSTWCYYVVQVPRRDQLLKACHELGLPLLVHYPHILADNKAFRGKGRNEKNLTHARRFCSQCLSLPLYPGMESTDEVLDRFSQALNQVFASEGVEMSGL